MPDDESPLPSPPVEPFLATELYTDKEIAAKLKVSLRSVHNFAADGRLPPPLKFRTFGLRWRGIDLKLILDNDGKPWREIVQQVKPAKLSLEPDVKSHQSKTAR